MDTNNLSPVVPVGKTGRKSILRFCLNCQSHVTTRQWNNRRSCCKACAVQVRKQSRKKPSCLKCGKECNEKKNRFCSFECFNEYRSLGYVDLICGNCEKQFSRKKQIADLYQSHACSIECGKVVAAKRAKEQRDKKRKPISQVKAEFYEKRRQKRIKANDEFKSLWFRKCNRKFAVEIDCTSRWMKKSKTAAVTLKSRSRNGIKSRRKQKTDWDKRVKSERNRIRIISKRRIRNGWSVKVATASRALKRR